MRKLHYVSSYTVYLFIVLISAYVSKAYAGTNLLCNNASPCSLLDLTTLVPGIVNIVLIISGIVFFFMLVLAGFNFITAVGDKKKIDAARKTLLYSVIGFAVIYLPFFVIPKIVDIAGGVKGLIVHNGQIQVNLNTSFTATPLPSYLVNTQPVVTVPPVTGTVTGALGAIIPKPLSVQQEQGSFTITATTGVYVIGSGFTATSVAQSFVDQINKATGYSLSVSTSSSITQTDSIAFELSTDESLSNEGYHLDIQPTAVTLSALTPEGFFNGVQTLFQLLPGSIMSNHVAKGVWTIPTGIIQDIPRFSYRGIMLDVARHFFSVSDVEHLINQVSLYKINVLHLHLSDDQGWRIAINGWDKLTANEGGQYYTQSQYQEIVNYANAHYMSVVPEIDMPSHSSAARKAYPSLDCGYICPITNTDLKNYTPYRFIHDVFTQLAGFNSPSQLGYLHIGGDESTEDIENYVIFIRTVESFITSTTNNLAIGWSETGKTYTDPNTHIAYSALNNRSVVEFWVTPGEAQSAVKQGAKIIMDPAERTYLDMKYDANDPPGGVGNTWDGYISVKDSYSWDPATEVSGINDSNIIGVESALWTETIVTTNDIDYMVFPRIIGEAEIAWSPAGGRSWDEYKQRLAMQGSRLSALGINYFKSPDIAWK